MNKTHTEEDRESTPKEALRDFILANHIMDRPVDKERMDTLIATVVSETENAMFDKVVDQIPHAIEGANDIRNFDLHSEPEWGTHKHGYNNCREQIIANLKTLSHKTKDFKDFKEKALKNPGVKKEYDREDPLSTDT